MPVHRGRPPLGERRAATQGESNPGGVIQKNAGAARCHHQHFTLFETHLLELLRRNLRFDQVVWGRIVRWFVIVGWN